MPSSIVRGLTLQHTQGWTVKPATPLWLSGVTCVRSDQDEQARLIGSGAHTAEARHPKPASSTVVNQDTHRTVQST